MTLNDKAMMTGMTPLQEKPLMLPCFHACSLYTTWYEESRITAAAAAGGGDGGGVVAAAASVLLIAVMSLLLVMLPPPLLLLLLLLCCSFMHLTRYSSTSRLLWTTTALDHHKLRMQVYESLKKPPPGLYPCVSIVPLSTAVPVYVRVRMA